MPQLVERTHYAVLRNLYKNVQQNRARQHWILMPKKFVCVFKPKQWCKVSNDDDGDKNNGCITKTQRIN